MREGERRGGKERKRGVRREEREGRQEEEKEKGVEKSPNVCALYHVFLASVGCGVW